MSYTFSSVARAVTALGVGAIVITGCTAVAPPLGEIASEAFDAMEQADSVRIELVNVPFREDTTATGYIEGSVQGGDLHYDLTVEDEQVEYVSVAGEGYVRANAAYWERTFGEVGAQLIETDLWLQMTDPEELSLASLLDPIAQSYATHANELADERGTQVLLEEEQVFAYEGDGADGETATLYFTGETHQLRRIDIDSGTDIDEDGDSDVHILQFKRWYEPVEVSAPGAEEIMAVPGRPHSVAEAEQTD